MIFPEEKRCDLGEMTEDEDFFGSIFDLWCRRERQSPLLDDDYIHVWQMFQ